MTARASDPALRDRYSTEAFDAVKKINSPAERAEALGYLVMSFSQNQLTQPALNAITLEQKAIGDITEDNVRWYAQARLARDLALLHHYRAAREPLKNSPIHRGSG